MKKLLLILLFVTALVPLSAEELRVVSLAPALTELICRLGKEKALVGRSSACNYPLSIRNIPVVGEFGRPNPERVVALKPTHVFANALANPTAAEMLRSAGIKVILKQCRNPEEYREWVMIAGKELKCEAEAQKENDRIEQELAEKALRRGQNRSLPDLGQSADGGGTRLPAGYGDPSCRPAQHRRRHQAGLFQSFV